MGYVKYLTFLSSLYDKRQTIYIYYLALHIVGIVKFTFNIY